MVSTKKKLIKNSTPYRLNNDGKILTFIPTNFVQTYPKIYLY